MALVERLRQVGGISGGEAEFPGSEGFLSVRVQLLHTWIPTLSHRATGRLGDSERQEGRSGFSAHTWIQMLSNRATGRLGDSGRQEERSGYSAHTFGLEVFYQ